MDAPFGKEFRETTRGRIVALLRTAPSTVDELAAKLALTPNAVRAHVTSMEADGLIKRFGQKTGATRPSHIYGLTAELEQLLSRAYMPFLTTLVQLFSHALPKDDVERLMRDAGRALAATSPQLNDALDLRKRVVAASNFLNKQLGALTHVEANGSFTIRGAGCPLAALTGKHPAVCLSIESLVSEIVGVPAHECCDRTGRPLCCFEFFSQT